MVHENFIPQHRTLGRAAVWAVFGLGVVYIIITALGFRSLKSAQAPIGAPFFSLMELAFLLVGIIFGRTTKESR